MENFTSLVLFGVMWIVGFCVSYPFLVIVFSMVMGVCFCVGVCFSVVVVCGFRVCVWVFVTVVPLLVVCGFCVWVFVTIVPSVRVWLFWVWVDVCCEVSCLGLITKAVSLFAVCDWEAASVFALSASSFVSAI